MAVIGIFSSLHSQIISLSTEERWELTERLCLREMGVSRFSVEHRGKSFSCSNGTLTGVKPDGW